MSGPDIPGYEITEELGRGGMGVVYKARQIGLNRIVALKMILDGKCASREAAVRFLIEAEAVAKVSHPSIVQIFHFDHSDGNPFYEMEFVGGGSLADRLDGTPRQPQDAARMIEIVARAMAEAHRQGIIHRDLKPGNILLTMEGLPKVADFGLAKLLNGDSALTATDSIVGSPSYMAPEQAGGKRGEIGPATDIYALGAILYELLTGRPPFRGATVLETLEQVKAAEPVPPSRLVPGLPRDVETIALKCLQKDPSRRYESALALAEDLDRFLAGEPIRARPVGALERGWRWCRRNPQVAALLCALGLLLTGGTAGSAAAAYHFQRLARSEREAQVEANLRADEARTVIDFLVNDLIGAAAGDEPDGTARVNDVLAQADRLVASRFARQPLLEAAIRHTLAEAYVSLAQAPKALPHAVRAIALRESRLGSEHLDTLRSTELLGEALTGMNRMEEARPLFERVLRARRRTLGPAHPETARALTGFAGTINNDPARLVEARSLLEEALTIQKQALGYDDWRVQSLLGDLAWNLGGQARLSEALALYHEMFEFQRKQYGPNSPGLARILRLRGGTLYFNGRTKEAAETFEEAVRIGLLTPNSRSLWPFIIMGHLVEIRMREAEAARPDPRAVQAAIAKALPVCDQAVTRAEHFHSRNPDEANSQQLLNQQLTIRGGVLGMLGHRSNAIADLDRAIALVGEWSAPMAEQDARIEIAAGFARAGEVDRSLELITAEETTELPAVSLWRIAKVYALLADTVVDVPERALGYQDRSVALLRRAIEHGLDDAWSRTTDPGFASIRTRADFRRLVPEPPTAAARTAAMLRYGGR